MVDDEVRRMKLEDPCYSHPVPSGRSGAATSIPIGLLASCWCQELVYKLLLNGSSQKLSTTTVQLTCNLVMISFGMIMALTDLISRLPT